MSDRVPAARAAARSGSGSRRSVKISVRESVFQSLMTLLMDLDLEPGTKLSIDGLARQLDVSQTPVREALARCESEGLVVRRPNAGYQVAPLLDRSGLDDLYDIRLLLEPTATERAARHANAAELADMHRTLERMTPPLRGDTYESYRDFAELDAAFHNAIAEASRSPLMADTLRRFRAHNHSYRLYFRHSIAGEAVDEHRAVLDAVRARDPQAAAQAMRDHLEASRLRLTTAYDS
ncbi:GntR family transcriptional regulator [Streptomyces winkii]|uniref:GntR family transcriptional regulator n=1 Tax=Streptomyces winkii TaxID=3051178 RepID=UPI0028D8F293|nr:GntR family transcriptional regulator [Streptomyces sp. DSM 40971]